MATKPKQKYFPKTTDQWHFEEPTILRRFSLSLVEMAVLTGVTLRLYRALVITHGTTSWFWLGGTFALGLLLLCAMATIHLANYPLHRWVWRAPLFALVEVAAESVTSLLLIYLGREPMGSARAEWSHWLPLTAQTLWTRELTVCLWALILAGSVWIVRRTILREQPVEEETVEEIAQA
jgi:hypothetical protein